MSTQQHSTNSLPATNIVTMTSREVAELTGKLHKHVLRDIDVLIETLSPELVFGFKSTTYVSGDPPREYRMFVMDRDSTLCLMAGYDANARMRIVKRWQELEASAQQQFKIPKTMGEALRLAADLHEQLEEKTRQFAEAQPMVQFHEEVSQADSELNVDETCALLFNGTIGPKQLRAWLKLNHWLDGRPGMNKPTAWAMKQGLMRLRLSPPINGRIFEVPVLTGKGISTLRHLYRTNELFINAVPLELRLPAPDLPV